MATVKKTVKKAQKGKKVPETPAIGDDLSISNAIRRIRKDPKDPDNLINQALRLHPITQLARAGSEAITRVGAALGSKALKKDNAKRDSTYEAQKKELQKKKAGGKVVKAKAGKQMMKRADGSTSQRGLWDNLRSKAAKNKATGAKPKAPSKAMLSQEKKIKAASKKK
jgi:hypothetical protein